jgi:hypothetical protein
VNVADVKASVRARDGNRCTGCGMTNIEHVERYGRALEVHRKVPGSLYTLEGCTLLCKPCHGPQPRRKKGEPDLVNGDQVNFRAPGDLHSRLEAVAAGLGLDVSNLVRMVLYENLATYEERVEQIRRAKRQGDS